MDKEEKKYEFQWEYTSSAGYFFEGQTMPFTQEEADWFNRDSPGVLKAVRPKSLDLPGDVEGRVLEDPPHDRMFHAEDMEKRDEELDATLAAQKLAKKYDIDLSKVVGSGTGGRIVKVDVERLIK